MPSQQLLLNMQLHAYMFSKVFCCEILFPIQGHKPLLLLLLLLLLLVFAYAKINNSVIPKRPLFLAQLHMYKESSTVQVPAGAVVQMEN
jgi:hypothetical protein